MVTEETYCHTRKSETNIPVFFWPGITSKFGLSQHKRTVHDDIVLVCDVKGCLLTGLAKEQIKTHRDQHTTCRSWSAPLLAQLSEYPILMEFIILRCTQIIHYWNQLQRMVLQHMYHLRTYHIIGHCDSQSFPLSYLWSKWLDPRCWETKLRYDRPACRYDVDCRIDQKVDSVLHYLIFQGY